LRDELKILGGKCFELIKCEIVKINFSFPQLIFLLKRKSYSSEEEEVDVEMKRHDRNLFAKRGKESFPVQKNLSHLLKKKKIQVLPHFFPQKILRAEVIRKDRWLV